MIAQQKQIEEMKLDNNKRYSMPIMSLIVLGVVSIMGILLFRVFKIVSNFLDWLFY